MLQFWYVFVVARLFCNITGLRTYRDVYGRGLKSVIYFAVDAMGFADFFCIPSLNDTWWYMSVAILLPLAVPVLCIIERRTGWIFLPVMFFVSKGMEYHGFTKYMLVAMLAIVIMEYDLVERVEKALKGRRWYIWHRHASSFCFTSW